MFKDQVVVISGGSSGLGLELAHILYKEDARLILISRSMEKLNAAKNEIESRGGGGRTVEIHACDVVDKASVDGVFKAIEQSAGSPDMLINSAGILKEGRLTDLSMDIFHDVMNINFFGTLHCIKAVLPGMREKGRGRIVNISSVAGRMGVFGYGAYCSSKHAITGLTGTLRCELAGSGVDVHIAYPPEFESPMVEELNKGRTRENKAMAQTIPVMTAEKTARLILKGVEKGRHEIVPGLPARMVTKFNQWFPELAFVVAKNRILKAK